MNVNYSNLSDAFNNTCDPNSYLINTIGFQDQDNLMQTNSIGYQQQDNSSNEIGLQQKENFESVSYNNGQLVKNSINEGFSGNCRCNCNRNTILLYFIIFLIFLFKFYK